MTGRAALAAALAAAVLMTVALVAWPSRRTIVLGRLGDAPSLTGFGPRTTHRGLPGRWTSGLGRVDLPALPAAAVVTLHLQASEARVPERVELFLDGTRIGQVDLIGGRQTFTLRTPPCLAWHCDGGRLVLQSPGWRDPASGERRGVFVSRVVVERGALEAPPATWLAALLLVTGVLAAAAGALRSPVPAAAAAAWGFAALALFRDALAPRWPWLAIAAWAAAAAVVALRAPWVRARERVPPGVLFGAGAVVLIALFFVEALTRGWVLGQPQVFDPYYPWRALLPQAWEPKPGGPLGDVPMLVYPLLVFVRERLLAGELPLWTASLNAGQPILAAYQGAVFSPLTWTALVVPLPQATVVIAALRLLVGGLGCFVFIRGLGLSRGAAAVAGTAYLLNPFSVIWLEHPPGGVPPFLPWMLHAATRAAEGRRFGPPALAIATALVLLGGHPHTGVFCVALGAAWAAAAALAQPQRWRRLAIVAAALVLAAGLTAIQVVPFLEYLFASRGYEWRQFSGLNGFAAPVSTAIAALVPRFLGDHAADTYAGRLNFLEQTMYAGIPVLVLAVIGVAGPRRDWRAVFFAATGVVAALAVYGAPGVIHVISSLPLIKSATLTRIPIVAITSAIVVAAFGVDALRAAATDAERRRTLGAACVAAAGLTMAILVALVIGRSFLLRTLLTADTWRWSLWAALLAAGTALAVAGFARRELTRAGAVAALTGLVALDLFVFGYGFHGLQPADRVYPAVPELTRLRAEPGPFRVVGAKGALMPNSALVYGLQDIRAYDGLGIASYADLLDVALAWVPAHQQHELHDAGAPLLDLLGVRYLLAPPDFAVDPAHWDRVAGTTTPLYRNRRELPRAFLADRYAVATGNEARRRLRDGAADRRREVLLEADPEAALRPEPAGPADAVGSARIAGYEHERVVIDTDAPARRWLVLTDAWFPGWRATVDGQPVAIARANFAFRAVPLPPGRHRVVFEYAPASFRLGAIVSALALALTVVWALSDGRRRAPTAATAAARG